MRVPMLMVAAVLVSTAAQAQGSISVCITDVSGGRIPGTTVTVWGPQFKQQVVTQASGCSNVNGLAPGSYTVTAELIGFRHRKATVHVGTSQATRLDLTLSVGAIEGAPPPGNLPELWDFADWIVYGRIVKTTTGPWPGSVRQTLAPVTVLNWHPAEPSDRSDMTFVQSGVEAEFRAGDEVVVLLRDAGAFKMQPLDGRAAFIVKDGALHPVHDNLRPFDGMKVEDFLAKLRALAK